VARYRGFLTGSYIQMTQFATESGRTDEVIAAALERKKLWPAHPGELYNTAADLARAAKLRSVHRRSGSNRLADVALVVLREAVAAGFRDGPRLQNDPAFVALHGRSDFDEILAALLAKK
jgi:hypothetical protein